MKRSFSLSFGPAILLLILPGVCTPFGLTGQGSGSPLSKTVTSPGDRKLELTRPSTCAPAPVL